MSKKWLMLMPVVFLLGDLPKALTQTVDLEQRVRELEQIVRGLQKQKAPSTASAQHEALPEEELPLPAATAPLQVPRIDIPPAASLLQNCAAKPVLPTSCFTMQLQVDSYASNQDEVSEETVGEIPQGTVFRRARVGWKGGWEDTEYRIEVDFALPGRPSFLDIWAGLKKVPVVNYVRVGHFFEPFSLERLTPNRYVTFMERSLPDAPFAPARNTGIAIFNNSPDQRLTWAIGIFKDADNFGDNVEFPGSSGNDIGVRGGGALTGRITYLPYWDECTAGRHYVHVGVAGSLRRPANERVRFAAQPEARLGAAVPNVPAFVDTGWIAASNTQLVGAEFAWVFGPLSLQSEYMWEHADRLGNEPGVAFHGWYATASYFLTGEHRPYQRTMPQGGVFDRVIPRRDFCLASKRPDGFGGIGAWEIAARLSHLNFNDDDVRGGRLTDVTVGLNWYLTPYLRVTSNYIRAILDNPDHGRSYTDIFAMRVGYDF